MNIDPEELDALIKKVEQYVKNNPIESARERTAVEIIQLLQREGLMREGSIIDPPKDDPVNITVVAFLEYMKKILRCLLDEKGQKMGADSKYMHADETLILPSLSEDPTQNVDSFKPNESELPPLPKDWDAPETFFQKSMRRFAEIWKYLRG